MTKTLLYLFFISISAIALHCKTDSNDFNPDDNTSPGLDTIVVNFEFGVTSTWKNIYVVWMEDQTSDFIQNITICQKLIIGGVTGTALPYWKINKYPISSISEIDAVTSATKANTDFSVSAVLKDSTVKNFVLYFEVDRSFDPNDWLSDQPALIYAVDINLNNNISEYELSPIGWTPNEATQNVIPNTPIGQLQTEMKYITHHKDSESFGTPDERSATRMVKKITAIVKKSVSTNIVAAKTNDIGISIFPNPVYNEVKIKSEDFIKEITMTDIIGRTILTIQPKTFETNIELNRSSTPKGTYFLKIKTSKGISTHKILIS